VTLVVLAFPENGGTVALRSLVTMQLPTAFLNGALLMTALPTRPDGIHVMVTDALPTGKSGCLHAWRLGTRACTDALAAAVLKSLPPVGLSEGSGGRGSVFATEAVVAAVGAVGAVVVEFVVTVAAAGEAAIAIGVVAGPAGAAVVPIAGVVAAGVATVLSDGTGLVAGVDAASPGADAALLWELADAVSADGGWDVMDDAGCAS